MATNLYNASDIAYKFLHDYPNLKNYIKILDIRNNLEIDTVGQRIHYSRQVSRYNLYRYYGIIIHLFIQKLLANRIQSEIREEKTELILKNIDAYFTDDIKSKIKPDDLLEHYNIFKDPNTRALDILENIKKVALSASIYYADELPEEMVNTQMKHFLEIKKYFDSLPYNGAEIKNRIDCEYFKANPDLVFDKEILYEIKNRQRFNLTHFNKLILHGFAYFKKTGVIIKVFKIYNPLLGKEITLKLDDIDMEYFEEMLKQDRNYLLENKV